MFGPPYKLVLPYPGEEQMLKAFACIAVAAMSLAALAGPVHAQYPERNITLIVPTAPAAAPTSPRVCWRAILKQNLASR